MEGWQGKRKFLERAQKDSTPAAGVYAPNVASNRKDLSHLTCFNCDQNGRNMAKYFEPKKNRDTSKD